MMGDEAPARNWYEDFLVFLRDADSDVSIDQQAQSEYAKLAKNRGSSGDKSLNT
jgi:hypothetical protein